MEYNETRDLTKNISNPNRNGQWLYRFVRTEQRQSEQTTTVVGYIYAETKWPNDSDKINQEHVACNTKINQPLLTTEQNGSEWIDGGAVQSEQKTAGQESGVGLQQRTEHTRRGRPAGKQRDC